MSKASLWKKAQRQKPPAFKLPDDAGKRTTIAEVEDNGDLSFADGLNLDWTYTPKEALALAKWLIDTFGGKP